MMTFAPYFWSAIWAMIAIGAVVTAALCLVVATLPGPHLFSRTHRAAEPGRRPHHGFHLAHHAPV